MAGLSMPESVVPAGTHQCSTESSIADRGNYLSTLAAACVAARVAAPENVLERP